MGGEPTFVSEEDAQAPEWNTEAMGGRKREVAAKLFGKLKERYAPLGLSHFGQGKWYPGEQLPRWSLNCFWRKDGEAVWSEAGLIADEAQRYPEAAANAPRLLCAVAQRLGIAADFVMPAYEDTFYYLLRERKLPANVAPTKAELLEPRERARLARVFGGEWGEPVGYVLPITHEIDAAPWRSSRWYLRGERCYLIPGDSPIGYRLPLDSLPAVDPNDFPHVIPPDPNQPFSALAPHREFFEKNDPVLSLLKEPATPATGVVRTSLCAQVRNGVLYVFMPPARTLEDYLRLVAAVEGCAQQLAQPVIIE